MGSVFDLLLRTRCPNGTSIYVPKPKRKRNKKKPPTEKYVCYFISVRLTYPMINNKHEITFLAIVVHFIGVYICS